MNPIPLFMIVWAAMATNAFWEAYAEGRNAWDKGKLGWKIKIPAFYVSGICIAINSWLLFWR